jgi:hypothetical protein
MRLRIPKLRLPKLRFPEWLKVDGETPHSAVVKGVKYAPGQTMWNLLMFILGAIAISFGQPGLGLGLIAGGIFFDLLCTRGWLSVWKTLAKTSIAQTDQVIEQNRAYRKLVEDLRVEVVEILAKHGIKAEYVEDDRIIN